MAHASAIDQDAVIKTLRNGRLAAAGLDVFDVEPMPPDDPLLGLGNVVLTPHVTWSPSTPCGAIGGGRRQLRRLRDGNWLADVVNQPTGY